MKNKILYEDEFIVAVEKLAGQLVVKDRFGKEDLSNILIYKVANYLREQGHTADEDGRDLFPLHRLDRDTSGVVIFAKDGGSHKAFSKLFENSQLTKVYWFFSAGLPDWDTAELVLPLKRAEGKKGRGRALINLREGSKAETFFELLEPFGDIAWIEARPKTGRLHQIRVHANSLGVPLLNDKLYGDTEWMSQFTPKISLDRFLLHAKSLEFIHPISKEHIQISCGLPKDMHAFLNDLKRRKRAGEFKEA